MTTFFPPNVSATITITPRMPVMYFHEEAHRSAQRMAMCAEVFVRGNYTNTNITDSLRENVSQCVEVLCVKN